MIKNTIISNGQNNFKNYIFSSSEWSAPTMVSAEEINNRISSFNLVGRKIKALRMIGLSYWLRRDWIEDAAYNSLPKDMPEEERQLKSNYDNISSSLILSRYSQIDEPLLVKFEDDDVFEIDTPQVPEFRFSMNCIPWFIDAGTNAPNVDANILFAPCVGPRIESVSVDTYTSDIDPMFNSPIEEDGTKHEMVSRIVLWLDGDIGLSISGWVDFCEISCIDRNNNVLPISFGELKPALFNWEDIHIDSTVGFEASNSSLHFGEIGAEHTDSPFMTLVPSGKDTALHIYVDDFDLFAWSITNALNEQFDEYGDYDFSSSKWNRILTEARKIIEFESFDDLFDYMISTTKYGLVYMNYGDADFWKNKDHYLSQLDDVEKWTRLTMSTDGNMKIHGF